MMNFGFGFMRLPLKSEDASDVDYEQVNEMVDKYIEAGYNYFDTGYGYHFGNSEKAIKECVINRYPREDVLIADKIPLYELTPESDMEAIFNEQLERCGVDYFDYYLVHNTTEVFEPVCNELDCFGFVRDKKEKGLVKKMGFSHHDSAEVLERMLDQNPDVDFVQLQINYLDWNNEESIQAKQCYEVARAHNVDVIIMEAVKGGTLVNIPEEAEKKFKEYNPDASIVSWALRFCFSLEGVISVLSGMSNLEQMEENLELVKDIKPLNDEEKEVIDEVVEIIKTSIPIPCTYCNYCLEHCEENIPISKFFELYNDAKSSVEIQPLYYIYYNNYVERGAPASACTYCGECTDHCTQHLDIADYLEEVSDLFDNPPEF